MKVFCLYTIYSVAEPKLFISGSDFDHNSGSSYSPIGPFDCSKIVVQYE